MRKKKEVTLQTIADELQLTIHTVSKALRGLPGMSESTRRDIFEAARRLGYKTKEQELSVGYEKLPLLSTKRRRFTMIMTQDAPFYQIQFQGIQERLQEWGHTVSATFLPNAASAQADASYWMESMDLHYYDGLFIPPAIPERLEHAFLQLPMPKVLINYPPAIATVDSVIWDVVAAIHQSVNHFLSMGHNRILYMGDIHKHRGFQLRWQAFQEAMHRLGAEAVPEDHITDRSASGDSWMSTLKEKLQRGRYTAILCAVQQDLPGIIYALQSVNLSIPEDISLISLEDMENRRFPQLSRPLLLMKEAGRRAAERLLWRIANPDEPFEHIRLQGSFYKGGTVRKI
ncbi:LacI family DNA-binding transcriptional regulator [Paenibacillus sp. MBLB4367]|uniref:LacI family DNA-binding transcriptional regulator n=1 Tax=Paenibacillus sp. MBLB4367 TaxID=3384767 RepID=UPI003908458C